MDSYIQNPLVRGFNRVRLKTIMTIAFVLTISTICCGVSTDAQADDTPHPFPNHVKAPSLDGGVAWINSAGPIDLADLKGKFVILDFWTYCCINCMHILPELKKLEHAYPNNLVVIGVHSAKFENEKDAKNIEEAVLRYEIEHPVVNDSNHVLWNKYDVNSWPSLRVIDPEGNVIAGNSGELTFEILDAFMKRAMPYYRKKKVLNETPLAWNMAAFKATQTPLRFPGKVLADEAGKRLFIADSNHNRIVVTDLNGKLLEIVGAGSVGMTDGDYRTATFNHPQGMALHGEVLYVADTENHMLRKVDLKKKHVATIAGNGHQFRNKPGERPKKSWSKASLAGLNSPWDLWVHGKDLYVAMAGPHQIWRMPLDESSFSLYAGNGREDIVDGPLSPPQMYEEGYASFAQPSGLTSDGKLLYVADSEGSSIRAVPFDPSGEVSTIVGTSHLPDGRLFAFGDIDGPARKARLQHCLGVAYYDKKLYVADTYNNKIKVVDADSGETASLAGTGQPGKDDQPATFDEPAGISVAAGKLYIADTNNHAIRTIDLKSNRVATLEISGLAPPTIKTDASIPSALHGGKHVDLKSMDIKAVDNAIRLGVKLTLPSGYKINPLAPMRYQTEAVGSAGPVDRAALVKSSKLDTPATSFEIKLPVKEATGQDKVKVSLTYYYCQNNDNGLCKMGSVVWTIPVKLSASASTTEVPLELVVE